MLRDYAHPRRSESLILKRPTRALQLPTDAIRNPETHFDSDT